MYFIYFYSNFFSDYEFQQLEGQIQNNWWEKYGRNQSILGFSCFQRHAI